MDEQNVVTTEAVENAAETTEPAKTEPVKNDKATNAEIEKLKAALTKASADAAEWKRQFRETQTEAQRAEAERADREQAMRDELETLRKDKAITDYTNKALEVGFDADTAAQAANAMANGDMNAVFDALKAFVEATKTRLNNEALNRQPGLSTGVPPTKNTTDESDMNQMRRWMGAPLHR